MCGRYALYSDPRTLRERFNLVESTRYRMSYNIAPTQPIAAITQEKNGRHLSLYRWGLVPMWAKELGHFSTINARAETIDQKPAFRGPFRHHRCLIPADGYFEWQKIDKRKQPWYIHATDGNPMAFAGLFDVWLSSTGDELQSAAIVTTAAGDKTRHIHDRVPLILPPEVWDIWLATDTPKKALFPLLQPVSDEAITAYPVSTRVNKPTNDDAECVAALVDN